MTNLTHEHRCGLTGLVVSLISAVVIATAITIVFAFSLILNMDVVAIPALIIALVALIAETVLVFSEERNCCVRRYGATIEIAAATLFAISAFFLGGTILPTVGNIALVFFMMASLFQVLIGVVAQSICRVNR